MGELIEGLLEFGAEADGFISKVEEINTALKNTAEIFDAFFKTGAMEQAFESFQNKIMSIGPLLAAAAKQGKLEELFGDAFEAAVERLGNLLFNRNFWAGIGEMWVGAFETQEGAILKIILNIGIALKTALDEAFQDVYQGNLQGNTMANEFLDKIINAGETHFVDGAKEFAKAMAESKKGPARDKLAALSDSLLPVPPQTAAKAPAPSSSATKPHDSHQQPQNPKVKERESRDHYKPEFTSLEKMGFIMSGNKVQNPYDQRKIDLLQQIVRNTSVQTVGRGWGAQDPNHTLRDSILETNAL